MYIPNYWSSHQIYFDYKNKPRQVFRFGWSDISQNDAKHHAISRCEEARTRILAGEKYVKRYDGKGKYLDISGLPIREKIIQRYDDLQAITTINSYGASCLNVENVMILDVDNDDLNRLVIPLRLADMQTIPSTSSQSHKFSAGWAWLVALIGTGLLAKLLPVLTVGELIACFLFFLIIALHGLSKLNSKKTFPTEYYKTKPIQEYIAQQGGYLQLLEQQVQLLLQQNPQASFNIYQTPQGFRLIALHDNFTANDDFAQICFDNLPVDAIYQKLCKVQQCFRARVTGKPWRMGINQQFLGYQYFWREDITRQQQQHNQQWISYYQQLAESYAACRFIKKIGNADIHPNIAKFIDLHDTLCKAHTNLPLA